MIPRWAPARHWRLWEAVALWCDEDPALSIQKNGFGSTLDVETPEAHHLLDLACREFDTDQIAARIHPERFMSWAESIGRPFPDAWVQAVKPHAERRSAERVNWKAEYDRLKKQVDADRAASVNEQVADAKPLQTRERKTLHLIIWMLVSDGYEYDPSRRNDLAKQFEGAFDRRGVSLSDETIRKHLQAAFKTAENES